ncbi:MAG: cytochrome-c peroxidase [Acidobacteria bacterium]|nr:MAG: cytochrome-c peroxidase [Acidobacteriota bacterium]
MAVLLICVLFASVWAPAAVAQRDDVVIVVSEESVARPWLLPRPVSDEDYYDNGAPDPLQVELGKLLFYDKLLSGNKNISCATCHHGLTDTGDGLSLPVGEGGKGLGVTRSPGEVATGGIHERVPRNAPPVFNLGAKEFERMFHDGRAEVDPTQPSGFRSPAGDLLPTDPPLDNILAVQAMFPVTSPDEMAGQSTESDIGAAATAGDVVEVWRLLAERLRDEQNNYVNLFVDAFDDIYTAADIEFVHAANAIAAFEAFAWRADNSPFDRFLRGDKTVLSLRARRGMRLFYGAAGCSECHAGAFQTDHDFHCMAMPQIGPGKGDGPSGHEDFGRERVTGEEADRFCFRTPTLRNVALTGPWGHTGAYNTLEAAVAHMLEPIDSLVTYDQSQAALPSRDDLDAVDFMVMNDPDLVTDIGVACEGEAVELRPRQFDNLIEFIHALTDPASLDLRDDVPGSVPSGLPVAD